MSGERGNPFMKKGKQTAKNDWFRFENAHKDEDSATDELTKIFIYGEIGDSWWGDSTTANDFVKLLSTVKSKKIELHVNSPGGSIFDGIAIYNALKQHNAEVEVWVDALAASAGSFIVQAGDKIIMTKAATMMIHDGSTGAYGDAAYLRDTANILDKLSNTVAGIYADRAGEDTQFWRSLMVQEIWYNAQEAVDAGLADEVHGETAEEDLADATNKWDLSVYNHAGRNAAPDPMETRRRIANQLKEAPVAQPVKNEVPPVAPTTEPAAVEPVEPVTDPVVEPVVEPATDPVVEPVVDDTDPAASTNFVPQNSANGAVFMVNGIKTNDPRAVQNHLNVLETFMSDTKKQARKDFVQALADGKKIGAPQIESLENYVLGLKTDEEYTAWANTWESAAALSMLQNHGGNSNQDGRQTEAAQAADDEIETAREVVNQLKISGLKSEAIEKTPSYQKLVAHDPNFKL